MRVDQPVGLREKVLRSQTLHAVWLALPSVSTLTEISVVKGFAPNSSLLTPEILSSLDAGAQTIAKMGASRVEISGFSTLSDPVAGAASVARQRAEAAATQLRRDLVGLGDSRVVVTWSGDGRLTNSALRAFRVVELFAN
jgi:outer membrane protein OmpA-like peptidoglycan-associated protein